MTRPRPTFFEDELERRLAMLERGEDVDRRLPEADSIVLATITFGSFVAVLITQVL